MYLTARQVNVHAPLVMLRLVIQSQLLTHLLDLRFDLLHMISRMNTLAHNNMQMRLSLTLRLPNPLLQNLLCLFDKLSVKIYSIARHFLRRVVLPEDVLRGLFVVSVLRSAVFLGFLAEVVG